jgi:hypothetical protein
MLRRYALIAALVCSAGLAWAEPATPLPGSLPLRRDAEPVSDRAVWTPSLLLLGLAAAGGGVVWWRRSGGRTHSLPARRAEHTLARVSSQALTPHASVHSIRWHGEEFLVGCTSQQVTLLARRAVQSGVGDKT